MVDGVQVRVRHRSSVGTARGTRNRAFYAYGPVVLHTCSGVSSPSMRIFGHPSSLEHDPRAYSPDHPDIPERIEAIDRAIDAAGRPGEERVTASAASDEELELVHDPRHVSWIRELCAGG